MKKNIIIIITVIALIGGGFYAWGQLGEKEVVGDVGIVTSTIVDVESTIVNTSAPLPEINYSSLEKDLLYTENEGKYVNLNDEGKKLLRKVLTLPQCIDDSSVNYCYEYEQNIIMNSSIVAFKDGVLLLDAPNAKGGMYYLLFDIMKNENMSNPLRHYSDIRNDDFIIYVDNNSIKKEQRILYYQAGMLQFSTIPKTTIYFDESYLYHIGMGFMDSKWKIDNNFLKITIFREQPTVVSSLWPKIREVTFDLNLLL